MLEGAHREAESVLNGQPAEEVTQRAKERETGIRRDGLAVDRPWVVGGHVDHFRIGRGKLDVALVIGHVFLRRGLEIACLLGALAQHLDRLHHILRLVVVGIAEVGGPLQVVVQHVENVGECGERLNAWIPAGLRLGAGSNLIGRSVALSAHLIDPLSGDSDLRRISRGGENLREKRVRIERNGREKLFQVLCAQRLHRRGLLREVLLLGIGRSRIGLVGVWLLRSVLRLLILRLRILGLSVLRLCAAVLRGGLRVGACVLAAVRRGRVRRDLIALLRIDLHR